MHNAIPLSLAALMAVAIIVIGGFYLISPERISGTLRVPRRLRPLVLARKKNAVGKDCRGLTGASRVSRRPCGRVESRRKRFSPIGCSPALSRTRYDVVGGY